MEIVGEIFKMAWLSEDGSMMSGLENGGEPEKAWEPELFKKAVCCMAGMKCWNGAFEALQGKANLENELKTYEKQLPGLQARFDVLNQENVQKANEELRERFAEVRENSKKIANQLRDAEKREQKAKAEIAGLTGDAKTNKEAEVKKLE
jgi:regulator of replication initiation timing